MISFGGPIAALVILCIFVLIGMLPEHHEDALHKFKAQCRKDGMTFGEIQAALAIRMAFVNLRRRASDHCVGGAGHVSRHEINEIARQLAVGLAAAHGQDAAKSFIGWVESCPDEEILYDDARAHRHHRISSELAQKGLRPNKKAAMHDDLKHSLKVIKR